MLETATRRLRDARDLVDAFDHQVIPAAEAAVTDAEAALADAEKLVQYAAAEAQAKAARAKLAKDYPDLQRRYTELLELVANADAAIEAANRNLPADAAPLATVEAPVRDHPALPRRIVSDTIQGVWHHQSGDRVADPSRVVNGKYQQRSSGTFHALGTDHCQMFDKRVVVSIPARPAVHGPRLAATPLPPLTAVNQANARADDLEARLADLEERMDDTESSLSSEISDREIADEQLEQSVQSHYHY